MKKTGIVLCFGAMLLCIASGCGRKETWERHIEEETVYVEGLEKDYTLLFLTDTHVVVEDPDASGQQAEFQAKRAAMFVNQEGISSREQFEEWMRYANENQVDAVLLGGDIIDSPSEVNLKWLEGQLSELDMPCLYVNGNHDWTYPWEYMTETARDSYLPRLKPLMQGNTAVHSLDLGEFTVVGIDDSTNQVAGEALPEYERILDGGKPVITVIHVPFLTQSVLGRAREVWSDPVVIGGGNYGGIYPDENSDRFLELTTEGASPVELVLAGHVHFYDRDVIDGEKSVVQVVGGAGYEGNACLIHLTGKR